MASRFKERDICEGVHLTKERTLCLIKPDAVAEGNIGKIITMLENNNFHILKMKMLIMNQELAQKFYYVHKEKHFYEELICFMTNNYIVAMILEREDAIKKLRSLAGDTDSKIASPETIRNKYGTDNSHNAVHASDSLESYLYESEVIFGNEKSE